MHLGRLNTKQNYHINGVSLQSSESEKDIGVIISNNLKPSEQCSKAALTANRILGQMPNVQIRPITSETIVRFLKIQY